MFRPRRRLRTYLHCHARCDGGTATRSRDPVRFSVLAAGEGASQADSTRQMVINGAMRCMASSIQLEVRAFLGLEVDVSRAMPPVPPCVMHARAGGPSRYDANAWRGIRDACVDMPPYDLFHSLLGEALPGTAQRSHFSR